MYVEKSAGKGGRMQRSDALRRKEEARLIGEPRLAAPRQRALFSRLLRACRRRRNTHVKHERRGGPREQVRRIGKEGEESEREGVREKEKEREHRTEQRERTSSNSMRAEDQ